MSEKPFVSVIVPCRNERKYIKSLIESIDRQDYPKDRLEVIVADGLSNDGTRDILSDLKSIYSYLTVIDNEKKIVPTALNKAINVSSGEFIIRLDVHSIYPSNYFSTLIEVSLKTGADNVGAMWDTCPGEDTLKARAIAMAMSHPFGVGSAIYRTPTNRTEPFEVDTVPFGCFRRSIFEKVGCFDETMLCNEDNDFNDRLLKAGGRIILVPTLKIKYFARENFVKLWRMFWRYAYFMPYVNKKLKQKTRLSRYVPSVFVVSLVLPLLFSLKKKEIAYVSYLSFLSYLLSILFVLRSLILENPKLCFLIFIAFLTSHVSYGLGYISGWVNWVVLNKKIKSEILDINR